MSLFQILLDSVPTKGKKSAADLMNVAANLIQRLLPLPEGVASPAVTQIIESSNLKAVKADKEKAEKAEKEPAEDKDKESLEKIVEVVEKPKETEEIVEKEP